jgi:hypothetical protein
MSGTWRSELSVDFLFPLWKASPSHAFADKSALFFPACRKQN